MHMQRDASLTHTRRYHISWQIFRVLQLDNFYNFSRSRYFLIGKKM